MAAARKWSIYDHTELMCSRGFPVRLRVYCAPRLVAASRARGASDCGESGKFKFRPLLGRAIDFLSVFGPTYHIISCHHIPRLSHALAGPLPQPHLGLPCYSFPPVYLSHGVHRPCKSSPSTPPSFSAFCEHLLFRGSRAGGVRGLPRAVREGGQAPRHHGQARGGGGAGGVQMGRGKSGVCGEGVCCTSRSKE